MMRLARTFRGACRQGLVLAVCVIIGAPGVAHAEANRQQQRDVLRLDRVVAVVNRQTILESDLEDEMQLAVLDPTNNGRQKISEQQALEQLISRALIQQQMRQDDVQAGDPNSEQVAARISQMRSELPACVRANCKSDAGWRTFLAEHDLTPERVDAYVRNRIRMLGFIEVRFRQGIRITPEEIESYYRDKLLPQYPQSEKIPPLNQVSSRIEEILLEQRVNVLFDSWLANLRKQGNIEVLDPALEPARPFETEGATRE